MTTPLWKRVIVYILEGLLALVFISPLIWVVVCSFSPQPGSAQSKGWGVNNYLTLFGYQEGLPKYLFNSVVVTLVAVVFSVVVCTLQAIVLPFRLSGPQPRIHGDAVHFDGAVCVSADSADGVVQGYRSERFLAGCRFGYYLVPAADEHVHHA